VAEQAHGLLQRLPGAGHDCAEAVGELRDDISHRCGVVLACQGRGHFSLAPTWEGTRP
jgi:hypothetical protein